MAKISKIWADYHKTLLVPHSNRTRELQAKVFDG
jgi:hypothetical protein